jgi:Flp pilus assembly pilin Flp
VIFADTLQGSGWSGFFIHARPQAARQTPHRIIALNAAEGRCNRMKLRDWIELIRIQIAREEGQTMAEYGVVLAVITVGVVAAIGLLAVAIAGKLGAVTKVLTG